VKHFGFRLRPTGKACTCLALPCRCGATAWDWFGPGIPGRRAVNRKAAARARKHRKAVRGQKRRQRRAEG
jgi:hypothetical protein